MSRKSSAPALRRSVLSLMQGLCDDLAVDADLVVLFVYDKRADSFHSPITCGELNDRESFDDPRLRSCLDRVTATVVQDQQPIIAPNVYASVQLDRPFAYREDIQSAACLPLMHEEEVVGVLFVDYRKRCEFPPEVMKPIERAAKEAAAEIAECLDAGLVVDSGVPPTSPTAGLLDEAQEKALDQIINLACDLTSCTVALWLVLEEGGPPTAWRRILARQTGLNKRYLDQAGSRHGDGGLVDRVIDTGESQYSDLSDGHNNSRLAREGGWASAQGIPINVHGKALGAMEVLFHPREGDKKADRKLLERLASLAALALENLRYTHQAKQIFQAARDINKQKSLHAKAEVLTQSACELVGADAARLVMGKYGEPFEMVAQHSPNAPMPLSPRDSEGLTAMIARDGQPMLIEDVQEDARVGETVKEAGYRSLAAVRLPTDSEYTAVLTVYGRHQGQFTLHHLGLLVSLGDKLALAVLTEARLLKHTLAIREANARLGQLPEKLREGCQKIEERFGYDAVNIQLVRHRLGVIETVWGEGEGSSLVGLKHRMDAKNPDIQVDIVESDPPRAELIHGWDSRFHRWIYNRHEHDKYERVWLPLVLVRDARYKPIEGWADRARWQEEIVHPDDGSGRRHHRFLLESLDPASHRLEIIGTLEVSVLWKERQIGSEDVQELLRLSGEIAHSLYEVSLSYVLRTVAEQARELLQATSAAVHFSYDKVRKRYNYEEACGKLPQGVPEKVAPRPDGQGMQAINAGHPIIHPSSDEPDDILKEENCRLWGLGVKTLAAFPLRAGDGLNEVTGVLYIHFNRKRPIQRLEENWVSLFAGRAQDAIREATHNQHLEAQVRHREHLQKITSELARNPEDPDLLENIAWTTKNLFAADLVSVVAYDPSLKRCISRPVIAGDWQRTPIPEPPFRFPAVERFLELQNNLYAETPEQLPPIRTRSDHPSDFIAREGIKAAAIVRLQGGSEAVGVMFIGHCRHDAFSEQEKHTIEMLANAAAFAIRNRRILKHRQQDLVTMAHQLKAPLNAAFSHLDALQYSAPVELREQLQPISAFVDDALLLSTGIVSAFGKEMGRPPALAPDRFDPRGILCTLCEHLRISESRDDVRFAFAWDPRVETLVTDRAVFTNVFYSLIHNALKYSERGSTVRLESKLDPGSGLVSFAVESTGEPILPSERQTILGKNVQGETVSRTGRYHSGIGLGLWIARELLLLVGGDLCLAAAVPDPRVARFVLALPMHWKWQA